MSRTATARWADLPAWWLDDAGRVALLRWVVLPLFCAAALAWPLPMLALLVAGVALRVAARHPQGMLFALIVCMGNVKVNYYTGWITLFPEYAVLGFTGAVWLLRAMESPRPLPEQRWLALFAAWTFFGLCSFVFAWNLPRVVSKAMLFPISGAIFVLTLARVRDAGMLERAMRWVTGTAVAVALYAIVQIAGIFLGFDTSLGFLRRFGNPDFEYSVGSPVLTQLTSTFRANSFFNDPNICAGFLAAMLPILLAPLLDRQREERTAITAWRALAAGLVALALVLTLSRSGFLGAACGIATTAALLPERLRRPRTWLLLGGMGAAAASAAAAIGVNALIIVGRLASSFDGQEVSARVHQDVFWYGLQLFLRYPITGVGLRNFGEFYQREIDPKAAGMMAHNAIITNLAETGLLGGALFLLIAFAIARGPWRALRTPGLRRRAPLLYTRLAGFAGALVALAVTNLFYDFSLRSFVWVICGLAVAAARLVHTQEAAA